MTKKRPFGVTILAILAAIAAILAIIHTLQMLHLFPISGPFGQYKFFTFDLLGAFLWGVLALIYIWVTRMLWNLNPQGWLFVVALAALNLIFAVISVIGQSSWQAMLPAIVVNGLILIYGLLPGTKAAFGLPPAEPKTAAPAAAERSVAAEMVEEEAPAEEEAAAAVEEVVDEAVEEDVEETAAAPEMAAEAVAVAGVAAVAAEAADDEEAAEAEMEAEGEELAGAAAVAAAEEDVQETAAAAEMEVEAEELAGVAAVAAVEEAEEAVEAATESEMEAEAVEPAGAMVTGAAATAQDLSYVEGIGAVYAEKLKEVGVDTPQALLEKGATPKGRKELAETTGISGQLILKWINAVDLYRIKGLGSEYAELLEVAGVDTVPELAQRNPKNLYQKMVEVNEEKALVRRVPSQAQVEDWVSQAKELPRVVSY